jgi:hypothetical protein
VAGAPDDDLKQLHDALLRACEDYDADEAIRGLGSAAVAIIGSVGHPGPQVRSHASRKVFRNDVDHVDRG